MEPDSEAKGTDLVGTEVSDGDETADEIRWMGDARHSGHEVGDRSNGDDAVGVDAVSADSNGNGASTNAEQLELDRSTATDDDHTILDDDDDDDEDDDTILDDDDDDDDDKAIDDDNDDKAIDDETSDRGAELITVSGGGSGADAPDSSNVVSRDITTGGSHDLDAWDDEEEWEDEDWDDEEAVAADRGAHAATYAQHVTLAEVLRVRSARIIGIVAVVTIVVVLMATVLLWQRVEDTRAEISRSKQVTSVPGLASVHRRLNRLETEIAAILGSPNGDPTGRADAIQQQLTALNQCVVEFQRSVVSGKRTAVKYC